MKALLGNPHVTPEQLAQLVIGIAGSQLGEHGGNFVRTLAANHRLAYLPEIADAVRYVQGRRRGRGRRHGDLGAPASMRRERPQTRRRPRAAACSARCACTARSIPHLIGGAVLRSGDLVIDGSLRTRLERIAYQLTA